MRSHTRRTTKVVIQAVTSSEETQETLALLGILRLGNQQIAQHKVRPLSEVIKSLRAPKPPEPACSWCRKGTRWSGSCDATLYFAVLSSETGSQRRANLAL